jgi:hypothetical protein
LNHHFPSCFLNFLLTTSDLHNVLKKETIDKIVEQDSYLTYTFVKLFSIKDIDRVSAIFTVLIEAANVISFTNDILG